MQKLWEKSKPEIFLNFIWIFNVYFDETWLACFKGPACLLCRHIVKSFHSFNKTDCGQRKVGRGIEKIYISWMTRRKNVLSVLKKKNNSSNKKTRSTSLWILKLQELIQYTLYSKQTIYLLSKCRAGQPRHDSRHHRIDAKTKIRRMRRCREFF